MSSSQVITAVHGRSRASEAVTNGFRVSVEPCYLPEQSDADARKFLFSYRIRITNETERAAQLIRRHWLIIDSAGRRREVDGDGVIGQQPIIRPGHSHEYASYCDLQTPWGTMEGTYTMRQEGVSPFQIVIARFFLVAGSPAPITAG